MRKFERKFEFLIFAFIGTTLILLFCFWLMFHTFSYDQARSELKIGSLANDFALHIPMIRSFSLGENYPPQYPLFPGEPIRYHFLFYFLVGMLEKIGIRIDWALNIPSALGLFFLIVAIYLICKKLFNSSTGYLATLLFLFNGSLSFLNFFKKHPLSQNSVSDILSTATFPSFGPWDGGDITAFWNLNIYVNQRHLALAFSLALLFIYTCIVIIKNPSKKQLPYILIWGLVIGCMPIFHKALIPIFALTAICYFIFFSKLRLFLIRVALIASVLILPQLKSAGSGNMIVWYPGYLIHDSFTFPHFISYWWLNFGFYIFLIPVGFLLVSSFARKIFFPAILIFIIANLFKFSPEIENNHKFFNLFMIMGNIVTAYLLFLIIKKWRNFALFGALIFFLTFSGIIDFFAIKNDSAVPYTDIPANSTATWIAQNTPFDKVILNNTYLYHPASLAGRKIFLGWPYYPWTLGYDTAKRFAQLQAIFKEEDLPNLCHKLKAHNIAYFVYERLGMIPDIRINPTVFNKYFPVVFTDNRTGTKIYQLDKVCLPY